MASGLSVGLAMGSAGSPPSSLGVVADAIDLETALYVAAVAPAFGCGRLSLPAGARRLAAAVEPRRAAIV